MVRGRGTSCPVSDYLLFQNFMRRFFFKPEERVGDVVVLSEDESHHIRTVLRLQNGAHVELFDGLGQVHLAELFGFDSKVSARIISSRRVEDRGGIPLWVGQGLLKGKNMDTVVQKCTELGVSGLAPMLSSRCQGRADLPRDKKKNDRWQRIIEEACKQCGRAQPMELLRIVDFRDLIASSSNSKAELKLLFWEEEQEVHLQDLLPFPELSLVRLLLGPEGGFTADEVVIARDAGWRIVSLGRRILRAETATLASVAILQHLLGAM
jgi:16S rRNA (uracil1498-N3)-methyltransferase